MEHIFYERYGKCLETKTEDFEKTKKEHKQCVKHIIDDPKALATPARKPKTALALTKRLNELKELQNTAKKVDREKEQYERDKRAQKIREEQMKERAERTKREREERAKRVQKNNQVKEAERKEQEELMRVRLAEQRKFAEDQKKHIFGTPKYERTPAKMVANVFRSGMKVDRTPVVGLPRTPLKTPRPAATPAIVAKKEQTAAIPFEIPPLTIKTPERKIKEEVKNNGTYNVVDDMVDMTQTGEVAETSAYDKTKEKIPLPTTPVVSVPRTPLNTSKSVVDMTPSEELVEISAYDMTKEKIPLPSTEDNYNVDDLSSNDETDPEDSPRKQIPKWAQKEHLAQHINGLQRIDVLEKVEKYFGRIQQPALLDFFKQSKKKYTKRRSSSAVWDSPMSDPTPGFGRFQKMFQKSPSDQ
ncbi:hypothetical protein niasHT_014361 [Heterodera trifolii]|uniref:Inner centromere protein ARK-binding domain-containing protein n=1 Tax=Heterodera trifolii TaxID=157864 RepID=A0ABD2LH80_9BILA